MKIIVEDEKDNPALEYASLKGEDANSFVLRIILEKDISLRPGMTIRIKEDDR